MHFWPNKDRLPSCLRHSFGSIDFFFYKIPNGFSSLANSFSIAVCHLMWPFSRKYGTVWYHPASSKIWYLTALSFVNFQEKLTGTSSLLYARVKPACSACCVFGARCTFLRQHQPLLVLAARRAVAARHRLGSLSRRGGHDSQSWARCNSGRSSMMLQLLFGDVAIGVCKCCMNVLDHVAWMYSVMLQSFSRDVSIIVYICLHLCSCCSTWYQYSCLQSFFLMSQLLFTDVVLVAYRCCIGFYIYVCMRCNPFLFMLQIVAHMLH
jgi:hypothetical protein